MAITPGQEEEVLDVLACDFRARPRGAPTVFDVLPSVCRRERTATALTIDFDPSAVEAVTGFVAAERLCCAGIDWDLQRAPAPRLRISAAPAQLDVLEQLFAQQ